MAHKDTEQLIQLMRDDGWEVVHRSGSSHYRCTPPGGGLHIDIGLTPSDHRGLKNSKAQLKARGWDYSPQAIERRKHERRRARKAANAARRLAEPELPVLATPSPKEEPMTTIDTPQEPVGSEDNKAPSGRPVDDFPGPTYRAVFRELVSVAATTRQLTGPELQDRLGYAVSTLSRAVTWLSDQGLIKPAGRRGKAKLWEATSFGVEYWEAIEGDLRASIMPEPKPEPYFAAPEPPAAPPLDEVEVVLNLLSRWVSVAALERDAEAVNALMGVMAWLQDRQER